MTNSIIFFKKGKKFVFNHWDCCDGLGRVFYETGNPIMYVGIPKKEMDEFFMTGDNLDKYLEFLTLTFDIEYRMATESEIDDINVTDCPDTDLLFIHVSIKGCPTMTNKYFNSSYNCFRYLWYQQYTNIAIIATNLYKLGVISDNMDILAIASSYQKNQVRALLPKATNDLDGLLFFRKKEVVIPELLTNKLFNSIFYKFPIYFNPVVQIHGTFFSNAISIIEAKQLIGKLAGIIDVDDIPSFTVNSIKAIYDDYILMKDMYHFITKHMDEKGYSIPFNNPILLSKELTKLNIVGVDVGGYEKKVHLDLMPKKEEVELPF